MRTKAKKKNIANEYEIKALAPCHIERQTRSVENIILCKGGQYRTSPLGADAGLRICEKR